MEEIIIKDNDNNDVTISVIGYFRVPELEKEFIMYSLVDNDSSNDEGHVLLGEVIHEEENIQIQGIDTNEKELVLAYYNEVINQIGGEENE